MGSNPNTSMPSQIKPNDSGESTKSLISLIKDQTLKMQSNNPNRVGSSDPSREDAAVNRQEWNTNSFSEKVTKQNSKHSSRHEETEDHEDSQMSKTSSQQKGRPT